MYLLSTVFDIAGVSPVTSEEPTEELTLTLTLTRVARFQQNFQTNYISKSTQDMKLTPKNLALKTGDIFFFIFFLCEKQGRRGARAFLMCGRYPFHNPL